MKKRSTFYRGTVSFFLAFVFFFSFVGGGVALEEAEVKESLKALYDAAQALFEAQEYDKASEAFDALGEFSDSQKRAAESKKKARAASYQKAMALFKAEEYEAALVLFETLDDYRESRFYVKKCRTKINREKYRQAKQLYNEGDYERAKDIFESLGKYGDSRERAQAAAAVILEREFFETAHILKAEGDLEGARDAFIEAGDYQDSTDQIYLIIGQLALQKAYRKAELHEENREYEQAYLLFTELDAFQNSAERAKVVKGTWEAEMYGQAMALYKTNPSSSFIMFRFLGSYKNSAAMAEGLRVVLTDEDIYSAAETMEREALYQQAKIGFEAIESFADSQERVVQTDKKAHQAQEFQQALCLREIGEEKQANAIFKSLGRFNNAAKMIKPVTPRFSAKQLRDDRTSPKSEVFTSPDGTQHRYRIYKGVHTWVEAKMFCEVLGGHLATMTTPEENAFVHGFMVECGYTTAYFGLNDLTKKSEWEWVTGEPLVYTNWHRGEPSRGLSERYGMYYYKHTEGTWNDAHFYERAKVDPGCSFICEWDEP